MSKHLIPQLRFKGFTDDWLQSSFGKVCDVYDGVHQTPTYTTKGVMFVSVENIKTLRSNKFISAEAFANDYKVVPNRNDILMTRIGDIGTANIVETDEPLAYYVSLALLKSPKLNPYFFKSAISAPDTVAELWKRTLHIAFPKKINKNEISLVGIKHPSSLSEQREIGEYFKQIDALIGEAEREIGRLEKMKLASLQKMFPRPGATTPEIRFAGFEGEWTIGPLSDLLEIDDIRNSKNELGREDVLSVSGEYGLVNQIEFQGRSFAGASLTGYKITNKAHVVYTKSPLKAQPFGIIKSNQYGLGLLSPLYAVYKPKNHASADFIHYYFSPIARLNNYLRPLINKGAKNTLLISDEVALQGYIVYPSDVEEQCVIAHYFRNLDELISAKRQKLAKLRNIKNSCLDKMFVNTFNL